MHIHTLVIMTTIMSIVHSFILFLASSIYLVLRFCWRTTHAWLIYILLLAHTSWLIYILLLACTHILLTHLFIWFHAFIGAQHMLVGLFIFIYILLLAHTSCFINILLLACTCIFLTHLFGFTLLAHNTCLAYLYFTFGIRFWRTYTSWLIYILLPCRHEVAQGNFFRVI